MTKEKALKQLSKNESTKTEENEMSQKIKVINDKKKIKKLKNNKFVLALTCAVCTMTSVLGAVFVIDGGLKAEKLIKESGYDAYNKTYQEQYIKNLQQETGNEVNVENVPNFDRYKYMTEIADESIRKEYLALEEPLSAAFTTNIGGLIGAVTCATLISAMNEAIKKREQKEEPQPEKTV